jgi:hypothetical protein
MSVRGAGRLPEDGSCAVLRDNPSQAWALALLDDEDGPALDLLKPLGDDGVNQGAFHVRLVVMGLIITRCLFLRLLQKEIPVFL